MPKVWYSNPVLSSWVLKAELAITSSKPIIQRESAAASFLLLSLAIDEVGLEELSGAEAKMAKRRTDPLLASTTKWGSLDDLENFAAFLSVFRPHSRVVFASSLSHSTLANKQVEGVNAVATVFVIQYFFLPGMARAKRYNRRSCGQQHQPPL